MAAPNAGALRRRVARAARLLEERYGRPEITPSGRPVESLVRTILSQNTSDANSGLAWRRLRSEFPSMRALARAAPAGIERAIRPGGLARRKSRRIAALLAGLPRRGGAPSLAHLRRRSDDEVMGELTAIDGVGLKTAACVLLFALGRDVCPVDTHVHRIASRAALVPEASTAERVFRGLARLIRPGGAGALHVNLIRLGRELCRPGSPACGGCPLRRMCRREPAGT